MSKKVLFAKVLDLTSYRAKRAAQLQTAIDHAIDIAPPPPDAVALDLGALLSEYWASVDDDDDAPTLRRPDVSPETLRSAA
jgi:hypothetical protein